MAIELEVHFHHLAIYGFSVMKNGRTLAPEDFLAKAEFTESRFRDCISCHRSFKFKSPDDWYCPICTGLESQRQHEQERGEALNVANGKFK